MSDALSFVEIDGQHVELLPARTVLSLFTAGGGPKSGPTGGDVGNGGAGGTGGPAHGKSAIFDNWFYLEDGDVYITSTGATGGAAPGGAAPVGGAPAGAAPGGAGAAGS
ncbi:MAG: hypothetical protein ACRDSR_27360 [Pseudonocardiaceae bacterium]